MNAKARFFHAIVILLGLATFFATALPFTSQDPERYFVFLAAALAAATVRIGPPKSSRNPSIHFLFVIISIVTLSPAETMVLGCAAALVHAARNRQRTWIEVPFQAATVAFAISASQPVYSAWHFPDPTIDQPLRLLLAASVYFVLTNFLGAFAVSITKGRSLAVVWRENHGWTLPYYLVGAVAAAGFGFLKTPFGWHLLLLIVPFIYLMYHHFRLLNGRIEAENRHAEQMATLHLRTIEALSSAIEAKRVNPRDHLDRVQTFSLALGELLHLSEPEMQAMRAASLLHDIGELAVPDHIISKPGRLTREEFERLKIHPLVSAEILERVKFPYPVVPMVRHHHEKWNGGGYPDGLRGEEIPMGARILAVADAFDALTSEREHRKAVASAQAVELIRQEAGIVFDPQVVEALARNYTELERRAETRRLERHKPVTTDPLTAANPRADAAVPLKTPPKSQTYRPASFLDSIAAARQEAQALFEMAQELGNSLSLDETLSVFAVRLRRAVPYDAIAVFVRRDAVLRPEYVSGENVRLFSALTVPVGSGITGWVAENRKPIVNGNPWVEPGYHEEPGRSSTLRSVLSIPLEGVSGVVAVLSLYHSEKDAFSRDHLRVLQAISSKLSLSIENALKYRQAESSASTDYLTGLYNARSLFLHLDSELARCRRLEAPLAILVSDLDGFKQVNDRFGHLEGNKLLQAVATKLKESCREYDCVARMGGDEFVLVLPGLTPEAVSTLIPRLRDVVRAAGREVLHEDVIGFSVGEAYFPEDGSDAEQLLAEADRRMYHVKSRSKLLKNNPSGYDFDSRKTLV